MLGSMNEPTTTAKLLKGDLSRHSPSMAQYQWLTFNAPYDQGFVIQVAGSVPQWSPSLLTVHKGK